MKSEAHDVDQYRVRPGKSLDLSARPTRVDALAKSKQEYEELLSKQREHIVERQDILYAHARYSLLVVFQGMDTSGKDGAIKHVLSGVNPQGCQAWSFKVPSDEELDHDYLWRTIRKLPERGRIGVFNRSYYEEVLVVRALPGALAHEPLPAELVDDHLWRDRYRDIVNHEDYLHRNGTKVIKIFLHISKDEQRKRLLARIDDPKKNWKARTSDLDMRARWTELQHAYRHCLEATSTETAPWYVIPADHKPTARLLVARVIAGALKDLPISYPAADADHETELREMRRRLESE